MDLFLPTNPDVLEPLYDELYLNFPLFRKTIDENRISKYEVLHEYERVVRFITLYVKKPKEKLEGGALQCNIFNVRIFVIILAIALVYFFIYVKPEWDKIDFIETIRRRLDSAGELTVLDTPRNYTKILRNKIVRDTYPNISDETFKIMLEEAYESWKQPSQSSYDWFFAAGEWTSFFTNVYSTLTRLATQNPIVAAISSAIIALLLAWGICKEVPDAVVGAPPAAPAQAQAAPVNPVAAVLGAPLAIVGPLAQAVGAGPLVGASGGGGEGGGGNQRRSSISATFFNGTTISIENPSQNDLHTFLNFAAAAQPAPLLGNVASPLLLADAPAAPASAVRRRRGSARGGLGGGVSRSRSRSRSRRSRSRRSRSRTNQKIKNQFKRFIGYVQKQDNFQLKGLEGGGLLKRGLRCVSASLGLSIMIILVFVIGIYFASIQVVNIDFETILKLVEHKLIGLLPDFLRDKRANGGSWFAVLREIFAVANAKAYMYIPVDKDFTFGVHPAVTAVIGLLITKVLKAIGDGFNFIFDLPKFIWTQSDTLSTRYMDLYNLCSDFLCEEIPKSKDLVQSIIKSTEKVAEKLNLKEIVPKLPKTKRQIAVPLPRNAPLLSSKASQSSKTLVLKDAEPKK